VKFVEIRSRNRVAVTASACTLDMGTKAEQNEPGTTEDVHMVRFAKESLALASVVGFVWMVCQATQLVG
jgi:hypothetical protein